MLTNYDIKEECLKGVISNKIKIKIIIIKGGFHNSENRDAILEKYSIYQSDNYNYWSVETDRVKKLFNTDFFVYDFLFDLGDFQDYIAKVDTPLIDFATGEIKDKPGTFLDFDSPETLDEQLAKIYELTEEEQELMAKSIKPWKDKLDVDADGLY